MRAHRYIGLRPEVLYDDFLDMAIAPVLLQNCEERIDSLVQRLADADQDSRGKGNAEPAGFRDRLQPQLGPLIHRILMRHAGGCEPRADIFEHQDHAWAEWPERL